MADSDDPDKVVISARVPPQVADRVAEYQEAIGETRSGTVRYLIREGLDADRRVEAVRERARERIEAVRQDERERARERVETVRQEERGVTLTAPTMITIVGIGIILVTADPGEYVVGGYSLAPIQIVGIVLIATMIFTIIVDTRS